MLESAALRYYNIEAEDGVAQSLCPRWTIIFVGYGLKMATNQWVSAIFRIVADYFLKKGGNCRKKRGRNCQKFFYLRRNLVLSTQRGII